MMRRLHIEPGTMQIEVGHGKWLGDATTILQVKEGNSMLHLSRKLGLLFVPALLLTFITSGNLSQTSSAPSRQASAGSITTKIVVKNLAPDGRVLNKHVYTEPTTYLASEKSAFALASHHEGSAGGSSRTGRRLVTITSTMWDSFGYKLWHQWVNLDWSWQYPMSVHINSQSRGWHADDSSVGWEGWKAGASHKYGWAGDLYPYSGWVKTSQGGWSVICINGSLTCHYYPWTKLWAHSDGTWYYYYDYWAGPLAKTATYVVRR